MLRGLRAQILMSLAVLLVFSEAVEAQAYGRVTVVVKNQEGKPLQGVDVVVTCDELERFREESKTNKKGKAIFSFTDATKVYRFHFEYEDFQPADMPIKPEIRSSITREVVLSEGQVVASTEGGAETRTIYSPAERVFNEGVLALQSGDIPTAKTKFLEALEKDDKMGLAYSALAGLYLKEKNYEAALASVNSFLEVEPNSPLGLGMLYDAHKGLGNEDQAQAVLKELTKLDQGGDTVAMIYNEGVAAFKAGDYFSAKRSFSKALELDPDLKEAVGAMSVIHFQEKNYEQAAALAERHLELVPGSTRSLRIRWDSYRELGDKEKAQAAFKDLAAADPAVLITELYNKGNELFDAGDVSGAKEQFERILEIDPEHARTHYRLGVCHASAQENADAKEHLKRFIELAPDDPEVQVAKEMLGYLN